MTEAHNELLEQIRTLNDELATIRSRLDLLDYIYRWQYDGEVATDVLEAFEELEDAYDTFAGAIESVEDALMDTEE